MSPDSGTPEPFYDPARSYRDNFEHGPFGLFAEDTSPVPPAGEPQYTFLGHKVYAPFGIAAGPLLNGKFVRAALDAGYDLPVYKTVRTRKYVSHAWPNVLAVTVDGNLEPGRKLVGHNNYSAPLSITNSFGVPSFDPDFWQPDLADAVQHAGKGQVVVASFQGTLSGHGDKAAYIADFALAAKLLKETGVRIIEANLSCPNEGTANLLCFDNYGARQVLEAIRKEIGDLPLMVKCAYFKDDDRLRALLTEIGGLVDAIVAINTISAEIVDENGQQALPGEGRMNSGVCGASIKWAGLEMTRRLAALREAMGQKFAVVGVGGVGSAADFDEYGAAGADAVMACTGAMWNPRLAQEIKRGWLDRPPLKLRTKLLAGSTPMPSEVAQALVDVQGVVFRPNDPVTFKSGIQSPVYCDNRRLPFHPAQWRTVIEGFGAMVRERSLSFDVVGGIEAAGIPHGAALAYSLAKPFVFIRKAAKEHGTKRRVEGGDVNGKTVLLVEDLVTTGGSSLSGVQALRDEGALVRDCLAIISYGFAEADQQFEAAGVTLHALTSFAEVLNAALASGTIDEAGARTVQDWLHDPRGWAGPAGSVGQ